MLKSEYLDVDNKKITKWRVRVKRIWHIAVGVMLLLLLIINTVVFGAPVIILSLLKLIPQKAWQNTIGKMLMFLATSWMTINNKVSLFLLPTKYVVSGYQDFSMCRSYLILSNHQSWLDIVVLQQVFLNKIPFAKFFMKKELIYVPIIGIACWALDFPLMKRYSKHYLKKHPEKKGQDLLETRRACQRFKNRHVSVVNFVEGTRFTLQKHVKGGKQFKHLLQPKAGGVALALDVLGDKIKGVLNVTIGYPDNSPSFWDFLCGVINKVHIHIELIEPEDIPYQNYYQDDAAKRCFQAWINALWQKNDVMMSKILEDKSLNIDQTKQ